MESKNGAFDVLSSDVIKENFSFEIKNKITVEIIEQTDSTNTLMRKRACCGYGEGNLIVASKQTGGKGRMGRQFFSPADTGVYMSLFLKPKISPEKAVFITTAAAVAVCRALEKLGVPEPQIKWVNDIFVNGKKVCGILTESQFNAQSGKFDYAVLGVGVNMYEPDGGFPDDIKGIAGAVFSQRRQNLRNEFVAYFINEFFTLYNDVSCNAHIEEYIKRNFVVGKTVTINRGGEKRTAVVLGIEKDDCSLSVKYTDGSVQKLNSGEISLII